MALILNATDQEVAVHETRFACASDMSARHGSSRSFGSPMKAAALNDTNCSSILITAEI